MPSMFFKDYDQNTPITAAWLNDVNAFVYGSTSAPNLATLSSIAQLRQRKFAAAPTPVLVTGYYASGDGGGGVYVYQPADHTSTDNGGTIIVASDGGRWKLQFISPISIKQFGAKGNGSTDDTAAIQAAINAALDLYVPAGTYMYSALSLIGWYGKATGAGIGNAIFKCNTPGTAVAVNAYETSDAVVAPFVLENMTFDFNGNATTGFNVRYRHFTKFNQVQMAGATGQNLQAKDSYLMEWDGGECGNAPTGVWLVGSNHRSAFRSVSFQGCTTWHIQAQSNGTANDGNQALEFSNCDVEYGTGGGIYLDVSSASFNDCYVGENINGNIFYIKNGVVSVNGGATFFGYTTNSYMVNVAGGKLAFTRATVNGQTNGGLAYLITGPASLNENCVKFIGCSMNVSVGGNPSVPGDPFDYGPVATVYTGRTGRAFSANPFNNTISTASTQNEIKATALTVTGSPSLISVNTPTINPAFWRAGEPVYFVFVYAATQAVSIYLSNGAFGGNYLIASLPATSGAVTTAVRADTLMPATAYPVFEAVLNSVGVGDYLTVYESFLADSRMLDAGNSSIGNLYKC